MAHVILSPMSFVCTVLLHMSFPLQTFQLQMVTPSGNVVPPNNAGSVTQVINIANLQKVISL